MNFVELCEGGQEFIAHSDQCLVTPEREGLYLSNPIVYSLLRRMEFHEIRQLLLEQEKIPHAYAVDKLRLAINSTSP